ncbi:hypothetical protein F2Q70_00033427 [Brassica cretica]|uniref:Protein kinase domain-containing protein n=1 Tax=Brassica cretica TaxID=69181 RepID=A0A8S9FRB7_BRACR|nr:hypothetical protein F2Q70_00033427 [Brassica cretica]
MLNKNWSRSEWSCSLSALSEASKPSTGQSSTAQDLVDEVKGDVLSISLVRAKEDKTLLENEYLRLGLLGNSKNILQHRGYEDRGESLVSLVEPYMYTLEDLIKNQSCNNMWDTVLKPKSARIDLLKSIVDGLLEIHSKLVIHRSLDPASIYLVYEENKLVGKIGNFLYSASACPYQRRLEKQGYS